MTKCKHILHADSQERSCGDSDTYFYEFNSCTERLCYQHEEMICRMVVMDVKEVPRCQEFSSPMTTPLSAKGWCRFSRTAPTRSWSMKRPTEKKRWPRPFPVTMIWCCWIFPCPEKAGWMC